MVAKAKPGIQVERHAYHGTSQGSCDAISEKGFDRGYNGVNGIKIR